MNESSPTSNHHVIEASGDSEKPPKKKSTILRLFLKALLFLLLLILLPIGYLIIVPTTFDLSRFSDEIDLQITTALGREVSIDGDIVLITGWVPSVRVAKVTVDNPVGWGGAGNFRSVLRFGWIYQVFRNLYTKCHD